MSGPADVLRATFAHHAWATATLIDHLEALPRERLDEAIAGTYGSIVRTLTHLVDADARYLQRLVMDRPPPALNRDEAALPTLRDDTRDHAKQWDEMLNRLEAGALDASITGSEDYPDTRHAEGLLMVQAIHHANEHRAQVCSTLGALGEEVPDLSGWSYWCLKR